jgi:hypothetical protein
MRKSAGASAQKSGTGAMRWKKEYDRKFKILQLDGGGIKGIIFLVFLSALERELGKPCCKIFDLIMGTSTGGIAGGLLANGMKADDVLKLYIREAKAIFTPFAGGVLNPKAWHAGEYDRKYVDALCDRYLKVPMKDLKTQFIITSVNMKDDRYTHFIKSYKQKYKDRLTSEMVKRTYSAPVYFGYYKDTEGLWTDGGVGVHNCTLMEAYIEAKRQGKEDYFILSCGTGYSGHSFNGDGIAKQIVDYLPMASEQATMVQIKNARELGVNFHRADIRIDAKHNFLDAVKYVPQFEMYGVEMAKNEMKNLLR